MPKISVIVPVYNAEKYLSKCIDSVLAQTFSDWELLLIDDGSPDRSGEICDEYAAKDSRIRVFHKQNGGVSSARNLGLDKAKGEYVTFVDSDDFLDSSYLTDFFVSNKRADLYIQGFKNQQKGRIISSKQYNTKGYFEELSTPFCYGEKNQLLNSPVCKLFLLEIISKYKIGFDTNTSYGEDHLFVLDYIIHCRTMTVSDKIGYIYNHHSESLTTRLIPYEEILYYSLAVREKLENINKIRNFVDFKDYITNWYSVNIVKAIMSFFKVNSFKQSYGEFTRLYSYADSNFETTSNFLKIFKFGLKLPTKSSYIYLYVLTKLYHIIKS